MSEKFKANGYDENEPWGTLGECVQYAHGKEYHYDPSAYTVKVLAAICDALPENMQVEVAKNLYFTASDDPVLGKKN